MGSVGSVIKKVTIEPVLNFFEEKTKTVGSYVENTAIDVYNEVTDTDKYIKVYNTTKDYVEEGAEEIDKLYKKHLEETVNDTLDIIDDSIGFVIDEVIEPTIAFSEDAAKWTVEAGKTTWDVMSDVYGDFTDLLVDIGVPRRSVNSFNNGVSTAAHTTKSVVIDEPVDYMEEVVLVKVPQGWGKLDDYNETRLVKTRATNFIKTSSIVGLVLYTDLKNRNIRSFLKNAQVGIPIILLSGLDNFNSTIDGISALTGNYCRIVALELGCDERTANYISYTVMISSQIYMYNKLNGGGLGAGSRGGVGVLAGISGKVMRKVLITSGCSKEIQDIGSYITLLVTDILITGSGSAAYEQLNVDDTRYRIENIKNEDLKTAKEQGHDITTLQVFNFTPFDLVEEGFTPDEIDSAPFVVNNTIARKSLLEIRLKDGSTFITATKYNSTNGVKCYNYKLIKSINWEDIQFPNNIKSEDASFHLYDGDTFNGNNNIITIKTKTSGIFSNSFTKFQMSQNNNKGVIYYLGINGGEIGKIGGGFLYKQNQKYIEVNNCWSTGAINKKYSGGLIGKSCANVYVKSCFTKGIISGEHAGGIAGSHFGYKDIGLLTKQAIDENKSLLDKRNNNSEIIDCYSLGQITGKKAGGICGSYTGSGLIGNAKIQYCYSTGHIKGESSGGIVGSNSADNNGLLRIDVVFSHGQINGKYTGGIAGSYCSTDNGRIVLTNSYSTGSLEGNLSGGLVGYTTVKNEYNLHSQIYAANPDMLISNLKDFENKSKQNKIQNIGIIRNCISFGNNNNNISNSIISTNQKLTDSLNVKNCFANIDGFKFFNPYMKNYTGGFFPIFNMYESSNQKSLYSTYVTNQKIQSSEYLFETSSSNSISEVKNGNTTTKTTTTTYINRVVLKKFKERTTIWNSTKYKDRINRPTLYNMPLLPNNGSAALPPTPILIELLKNQQVINGIENSKILKNLNIINHKITGLDTNVTIIKIYINNKEVDITDESYVIKSGVNNFELYLVDSDESIYERLVFEKTVENSGFLNKYASSLINAVELPDITKGDIKNLLYMNVEEMLKYDNSILLKDKRTYDNLINLLQDNNKTIQSSKPYINVELTDTIEITDEKYNEMDNTLIYIATEPNNTITINQKGKEKQFYLGENHIIMDNKLYRKNSLIKIHDIVYRIVGFSSLLLEKSKFKKFGMNYTMNEVKGNSKSHGSKYNILGNRRR